MNGFSKSLVRNREYARAWRAKNPGYFKAWRAKNAGKHREENYRWRRKNRDIYQKQKNRYYRKTAYAINHHKRWEPEEDSIVLKKWPFPSDLTDHKISKIIGRSVNSIQNRRHKLKNKTFPI